MAFRRRGSRPGFRSFPRARGWRSNRKWIGKHTSVNTTFLNAGIPQVAEMAPTFFPLVGPEDYGGEDAADLGSEQEVQERSKVIRTVGQFSWTFLSLPAAGDGQVFTANLWWYFAVLNQNDVANAQIVDVETGFGNGTDSFSITPEHAPALWRQPIKRFGTIVDVVNISKIVDDLYAQEHASHMRSFDFKPRAALQTPQAWYLVVGGEVFFLEPTPMPEALACEVLVTSRTLIAD